MTAADRSEVFLASFDVYFDVSFRYHTAMRTTLTIDDELLSEAERITGVKERVALVREAFKALIERESARRLAALGATEPDISPIPRRKQASE
jgi:Arc/MetJ family transcription regulator